MSDEPITLDEFMAKIKYADPLPDRETVEALWARVQITIPGAEAPEDKP